MGAFLARIFFDSSGRRCEAKPPPGIVKVNDSVWSFCSPEAPDVDIIFFHGLQFGDFQDAFWKTWQASRDIPQVSRDIPQVSRDIAQVSRDIAQVSRDIPQVSRDIPVVWPKDWLSKIFPSARILSISYNSSATQTTGQSGMYALGENLVSDIILCNDMDIGQNRPVVLVGHSWGGIVIKQFLLSAVKKHGLIDDGNNKRDSDRIKRFRGNFKGVFYYATPHGGAELADLTKFVDTSPILGYLKTHDKYRQRINEDFSKLEKIGNSRSYTVVEGKETSFLKFSVWVVRDSSARQNVNTAYTHDHADHIQVCKATVENDPIVIGKLSDFIRLVVPGIRYSQPINDSKPESIT